MLVLVFPVNQLTTETRKLVISVIQNVWRQKARLIFFIVKAANPLKLDAAEI